MKIIVFLQISLELDHLVLHVATDQRVEGAEGLVEEQDLRIVRQRAPEPDALLHAAGELFGERLPPSAQADLLEDGLGGSRPLGLLLALDLQAERHVVDDPAVRQQAEMLEDHADLLPAELPQAIIARLQDVLAVDQDLAGGRLMDPVDHADEGRLAGAGEPHDHEDLAQGDVERHVPNRGDASGLLQELLAREQRIRGADDALGLRSVHLPDVAARNGGVAHGSFDPLHRR